MLKIISLKLLANEENIYKPLHNEIYKFLITRLKELQKPKKYQINRYVADKANYAGN